MHRAEAGRNRVSAGVPRLLVLAFLFAVPVRAQAVEELRPRLAELSKQIARFLKGREETAIAVGAFTGPARLSSSAGPGIKKILAEELGKLGVKVRDDAALEIKGDYLDIRDPETALVGLRLKATVMNREGDEVVRFEKNRVVEDRDVVATVLMVDQGDLGLGPSRKQESDALARQLAKPSCVIRDDRVCGLPDALDRPSPYGVEVLVREDGKYRARKPAVEKGRAFVPLRRGEVFAVRLVNDSPHEAAVELLLDGVSMFGFSKRRGYRHVLVPRKGSVLIRGWHRTNRDSDEFVVTEFGKSAVKELRGNPDMVGTITAKFAAAWDPARQGDRPTDEAKGTSRSVDAVGRGGQVKTAFTEVRRKFGRTRAIVNIRYSKPTK